jgi:hypothetical protein
MQIGADSAPDLPGRRSGRRPQAEGGAARGNRTLRAVAARAEAAAGAACRPLRPRMFPPTVRAAAIMNSPGASVSAGAGTGRRGPNRRFVRWAASYEPSQLQTAPYGPGHDAAVRYARQHVPRPGTVLDVGCGTGRLPARMASAYRQAQVAGVDASTTMIRNAVTTPNSSPGSLRSRPRRAANLC